MEVFFISSALIQTGIFQLLREIIHNMNLLFHLFFKKGTSNIEINLQIDKLLIKNDEKFIVI